MSPPCTKCGWGLLLACLAAPGSGQELAADVTTLQLDEGLRYAASLAHDLDADGLLDLVLVTSRRRQGPRHLQVHLQRDRRPRFDNRPDRPPWRIPADVVGIAAGDLTEAPGSEVLLFSAGLAVALSWGEGAGEPRVTAIAGTRFLWQPRGEWRIVSWQPAVRDLDGDGRADLLLPEPGRYRIVFQDRDAGGAAVFARGALLALPPGPAVEDQRRQRVELRLSFGIGPAGDPWLLRVNDVLPAPQVADWDADGDLDVIALRNDELLVWPQGDGGGFGDPERHHLEIARTTAFDPVFVARTADVNGDGRADVLIGTSRTVDSEVTSTVAVYVQGDARWGSPADRLRFRGFAGLMDLEDVDGDGRPELVVGTLRTDLLDALTASDGRLDAQLNVLRNGYRGSGGGFERPVALVQSMVVRGGITGEEPMASFFGDCDGDGLRDLLVREPGRGVHVQLTRARGRGLQLTESAWQLRVDRQARVRPLPSASRPSLLIVEEDQLVHVRFR